MDCLMDVTGTAQLAAMADGMALNDQAGITMLKTAIDSQAAAATELLKTLPQAPQARAEGKGTLFDAAV
jgi:hypothetical protein